MMTNSTSPTTGIATGNTTGNTTKGSPVAAFFPRRRKQFFFVVAALALIVLAVLATLTIVNVANHKPTVPSDAALYVYDTNTMLAENGRVWAWSDDANGSMSETDPNAIISCPVGSTNSATFISLVGGERDPAQWAAWEPLGYGADQVSVLLPPLTPDRLGQGAGKALRMGGGTFSLGVACTTHNGLAVTAAFFRTITVDPGGKWTMEPFVR